MKRFQVASVAVVSLVILALLLAGYGVRAHENRDVGPYNIVFGWRVEPAYVGVYNGPDITIRMKDDHAKTVEGAEKMLKLEVSFGDQTRTLRLGAAFGNPGHYQANLIPTRPGDYTFTLSGKIGDTEINEKWTSADGKFSSVEPASDVLFPDANVDIVNLQAQIDALKAEIEALKSAGK